MKKNTLYAIFLILNSVVCLNLSSKESNLPRAVSNNAVTSAVLEGQEIIFSFSGLTNGKTYKDIISTGYSYNTQTNETKTLSNLADGLGRLASIAVTINNRILVIGGYTVAKDHSEKSTPEIVEYLPETNSYELITEMPVPVDDTVALTYKNRYLYLVSGWFDVDNVSLVQVYDLKENIWFNATPFPGSPVFGHAGGIVDNRMLIADGVKVIKRIEGKRVYGPSDENWLGTIHQSNPKIINWEKIKKHPFKPHYRMASTGVKSKKLILFAGGSDNPYNFNGIGYDGNPSKPSNHLFGYDLISNQWKIFKNKPLASMDHRGLIENNDKLYILGGMGEKQKVLSDIQIFELVERTEE